MHRALTLTFFFFKSLFLNEPIELDIPAQSWSSSWKHRHCPHVTDDFAAWTGCECERLWKQLTSDRSVTRRRRVQTVCRCQPSSRRLKETHVNTWCCDMWERVDASSPACLCDTCCLLVFLFIWKQKRLINHFTDCNETLAGYNLPHVVLNFGVVVDESRR